jgi:hypothetical protein
VKAPLASGAFTCAHQPGTIAVGHKNGATSLYLAKREGRDLIYVGKAGTGFIPAMIIELHKLMKPSPW